MIGLRFAPSFVLALLAAACSGGSAVGTYVLDKEATKKSLGNSSSTTPAVIDAMEHTVELKADGAFTTHLKVDVKGNEIDHTEAGTWKLDGNKLLLTGKDKATGKEEAHAGDCANGTLTLEGPDKMRWVFRRK